MASDANPIQPDDQKYVADLWCHQVSWRVYGVKTHHVCSCVDSYIDVNT